MAYKEAEGAAKSAYGPMDPCAIDALAAHADYLR